VVGAADGRVPEPEPDPEPIFGQFLLDVPEDEPFEPVEPEGVVPAEPLEPVEPLVGVLLVVLDPVLDPVLLLVLEVLVAALATSAPPVIRPVVSAPMATTLRRRRIFMTVAPSGWCLVPLVWRNVATVRSGPVGLSRRTSRRDRSGPGPPAMLTGMPMTIRSAVPDDAEGLREIELLAGARFGDIGMESIAEAEPASADALSAYALAGRSWVALDADGCPVGYVIVDVVDGNAHIEQISVRPDHQGTGMGRALIERVRDWAAETGRPAITLTTFTTVPWNGPLYAHLGFVPMAEDELGPDLRALRDAETQHGLDPSVRSCMRRTLPDRAGS
jgi:GNAT superfamily N-acetyltransferase